MKLIVAGNDREEGERWWYENVDIYEEEGLGIEKSSTNKMTFLGENEHDHVDIFSSSFFWFCFSLSSLSF